MFWHDNIEFTRRWSRFGSCVFWHRKLLLHCYVLLVYPKVWNGNIKLTFTTFTHITAELTFVQKNCGDLHRQIFAYDYSRSRRYQLPRPLYLLCDKAGGTWADSGEFAWHNCAENSSVTQLRDHYRSQMSLLQKTKEMSCWYGFHGIRTIFRSRGGQRCCLWKEC